MTLILATRALAPHPSAPPKAKIEIEAGIMLRPEGGWAVQYAVTGEVDAISLAARAAAPERRDGLWQTSCFELFAGIPGEAEYQEFNLAPSGDWAAYGFTGYREAMHDLALDGPVTIARFQGKSSFVLIAELPLPFDGKTLNFTTVIEEKDGTRSWWAAVHATETPDFHDRACMTIALPSPK
ncbi:DOMON-like domain-containing protein [Sphingomonas sp.]|uniref:DOMON-like domain-containing protein n=1 Tax=Sphingomonas sp. TaxID=28214 RepID=UPI001B0E43A8|nr:DOMON-like domain-containing protein [Sphingomonas sp.]MBO9712830.1 DOMON-like domain-containing protein [Sphingomonas sp.]